MLPKDGCREVDDTGLTYSWDIFIFQTMMISPLKYIVEGSLFSFQSVIKLFIIIFFCFFLTNFSWALPDGSPQLKNDQSLNTDKQLATEDEASLTREQKIPLDKKELFTRGEKAMLEC